MASLIQSGVLGTGRPGLGTVQHCLLSLLKLTSIESVIPSNHLVLCCPLILLPSIFPSIRVFSNESTLRFLLIPGLPCHTLTNASPTTALTILVSHCVVTDLSPPLPRRPQEGEV